MCAMNLTYNDRALVLRRERWRENDKRVTLYTFEHGKIDAVAVGASRILSKLGSHLEPLCEASVMIAAGRRGSGEKIAQAVTERVFIGSNNDTFFSERVAALGLVARVVDHFTERYAPDPSLYALAREGWHTLSRQPTAELLSGELGIILYALLAHAGSAPQFERCVVCSQSGADISFKKFSASEGGVVCTDCPTPRDAVLFSAPTPRVMYIKEFLRWRGV